MRFIHCADFHIDSPLSNLRTEEESGLTTESLLAEFGQMVSYAHAHDISSILISGDLFDSDHVSRTAALSIRQIILNNPDLIFYYLRGNHDKSCVFHVGTAPDNLLTFEESWTYYEPVPGITICGIETGGAKTDAASSLELGPDDFNLVMLHGNPDDFGNLAHRNIDYLAMGHIHKPSSRKIDTRCHMVYPGCPMGRGWDETGPRGFVVVDVNDHTHYCDYHFVDFAPCHFCRISADVSGCTNSEEMLALIRDGLSECGTDRGSMVPASGDMVRIELTGSLDPDAEKNLSYLTAALSRDYRHIELVDHTRLRVLPADVKDPSACKGIRSSFVRLVSNAPDLDPDLKNEILETGLRLLGGESL